MFGVEYSFQDEVIVKELGRMTMTTKHKAEKMELMFNNFLALNNLNRKDSVLIDNTFKKIKPGYVFKVPGSGNYVITMEPVTIEFNTSPKTVFQIIEASTPIFKAAELSGLKPYVNPGAERSGMGHIHIGGETLAESPFYKNPNLLRNILVYYHKHPSLLYGFAEAYDIGDNSNIETFHSEERQIAFEKSIAEFDQWYARALSGKENMNLGLKEFIRILYVNEPKKGAFFDHYRFINLEHLEKLRWKNVFPEMGGKLTVEFRTFRPQKSPEHALANTKLLLDLMESLSRPGYLEPFVKISKRKFKNFWSAGKIKSDWDVVKKFIKHEDLLSDEMLKEAVLVLEDKKSHLIEIKGLGVARVYETFSKKEDKGSAFELRIDDLNDKMPGVEVFDQTLEFELVERDGKKIWITYIDTKELGIGSEQVFKEPNLFKIKETGKVVDSCREAVESFL